MFIPSIFLSPSCLSLIPVSPSSLSFLSLLPLFFSFPTLLLDFLYSIYPCFSSFFLSFSLSYLSSHNTPHFNPKINKRHILPFNSNTESSEFKVSQIKQSHAGSGKVLSDLSRPKPEAT
jgi:hypothetical protein